jgi:hypothetical protein
MRSTLLAVSMVIGLWGSACDNSSPGAEGQAEEIRQTSDVRSMPDGIENPEANVGRTDVAWSQSEVPGTWAQLQVVSTFAQAPLIGQVNTLSKAVVHWQVEATDTGYSIVETVCELRLESDTDLATTIIPDAFINSILKAQKSFTLDFEQVPPVLHLPPVAQVHGALLEDPMNDAMPTTADDPRVIDQDGDGQPGMTVFVSGIIDGALYVVQRSISQGTGTVVAPGRVEGLFGWIQEQIVLGSDNPILDENVPQSGVDPDPTKSFFIAVRVQEGWTCSDIIAHRQELFGESDVSLME